MRRPEGSSYKWALVCLLWMAVFLNYADRQAIFSTLPLLKTEFGLSNTQLGLLGSVFTWVYSPLSPLVGYAGDRLSRRKVILASLLIWSVITFLTGLAHSVRQLLVLRAVMGVSEAAYFPAALALISDYHGGATRSRAVAIHGTGVNLGVVGGGALAGYLADLYGWRIPFYVFGVAGILLAATLRLGLREPPATTEDRARGSGEACSAAAPPLLSALAAVITRRASLLMIFAFVGVGAATWIFRSWMPFYLHERFGMSLTMAGVSGTVYTELANVVAAVAGGVLGDRLAGRWMAGRTLVQIAGLAVGVPFIALVGWTASSPVLIAAMVGFGVSQGLYYANFAPALYDVLPANVRATAIGVANLGWGVGGGCAILLAGALSDTVDWSWILSAAALLYLGSAGLLVLALPSVRRGDQHS